MKYWTFITIIVKRKVKLLINIQEVYLHILDLQGGTKVFSEKPLLLDAEVENAIISAVDYFYQSIDVSVSIAEEQALIINTLNESDAFQDFALKIADLFVHAMEKSEDIKSCGLLCAAFTDDEANEYVAVLKLNYKTIYAHAVQMEEQAIRNQIVKNMYSLPLDKPVVDEGFLLELHTKEIRLKDKQVTLDGKKTNYISDQILGIRPALSAKKAIHTMSKAAEKVIEKFQSPAESAVSPLARVHAAIEAMVDEKGCVESSALAQSCFDTDEEKQAYEAIVAEKGVDQAPWEISETQRKKVKRTQKIKTSSGVEITVPYHYIAREDNLKIVNHEDGSVTITLENLGELI